MAAAMKPRASRDCQEREHEKTHLPPAPASSCLTRPSRSEMCFSRAEESLGSVTAMMGSLREATSSCCGGGWGVVFKQLWAQVRDEIAN